MADGLHTTPWVLSSLAVAGMILHPPLAWVLMIGLVGVFIHLAVTAAGRTGSPAWNPRLVPLCPR